MARLQSPHRTCTALGCLPTQPPPSSLSLTPLQHPPIQVAFLDTMRKVRGRGAVARKRAFLRTFIQENVVRESRQAYEIFRLVLPHVREGASGQACGREMGGSGKRCDLHPVAHCLLLNILLSAHRAAPCSLPARPWPPLTALAASPSPHLPPPLIYPAGSWTATPHLPRQAEAQHLPPPVRHRLPFPSHCSWTATAPSTSSSGSGWETWCCRRVT